MKLPPLILAFHLLFLGVAAENSCEDFGNQLTFKDQSTEDAEIESYVAQARFDGDTRYLKLRCYSTKLVIDSSQWELKLTINKPLDCSKAILENEFYAYFDDQKYVAVGFSIQNQWCHYRLDWRKAEITTITPPNSKDLTSRAFKWSKKSITVDEKSKHDFTVDTQKTGLMIAEYVSVGWPRIVLNCYERSARLRTPKGQLIAAIDMHCSEEFIEALYIFQYETSQSPGRSPVYQLGRAENKGWQTLYNQFTWLYYFTARRPSRNCYWLKVPNNEPNWCPFLKHEDLVGTDTDYINYRRDKKLTGLSIYRNVNSLYLRCFKDQADNIISVVTDEKGDHLITIKSIDCSKLEKFDGNLYVSMISDEGTQMVIVGKKESPSNQKGDVCIYNNVKTNDKLYSWVYYGHTPEEEDWQWEKVSTEEECYDGTQLSSSDPKGQVTARYLSLKNSVMDDLILECQIANGIPTGVVKKLSMEVVISIPNHPCGSRENLEIKSFMYAEKIEGKTYIEFGIRRSIEEDWCRLEICIDCGTLEAKFSFVPIYKDENALVWSEAAGSWTEASSVTTRSTTTFDLLYEYKGETSFILMESSFDNSPLNKVVWNLRGTHFAYLFGSKLSPSADTDTAEVSLHFVVESNEGGSTLLQYIDCSTACETHLTSGKTIWVFYFSQKHAMSINKRQYQFKVRTDVQPTCVHGYNRDLLNTVRQITTNSQTSTFFTRANPRVEATCCNDGVNFKLGNDFIFSSTKIPCSNLNKFFLFKTNEDNMDTLVIGWDLNDSPSGEDQWCWYKAVRTTDTFYFIPYLGPSQPDRMIAQWYKFVASKDNPACSTDTAHQISLSGSSDSSPVVATHLGIDRISKLKFTLKCKKNKRKQKESVEIFWEDDMKVYVDDMACSSIKALFDHFIFRWDFSAKTFVAIVRKYSVGKWGRSEKKWCRIDVCMNCGDTYPAEVNINEKKPANSLLAQLSEPGFFFKSNGLTFQEAADQSNVKIYYIEGLDITFVQCCFLAGSKADILTPRGKLLGSVGGINCLTTSIYKAFIVIKQNGQEILKSFLDDGNVLKTDGILDWYYGFAPADSPVKDIEIYLFYQQTSSSSSVKTVSISDQVGSGTTRFEKSQIKTTSMADDWKLVAKYVHKPPSGFELRCYCNAKKEQFSLIYHQEREHVMTITKFACSSLCEPIEPLFKVKVAIDSHDPDEGKKVVFVGVGNVWFSHEPGPPGKNKPLITRIYGYNSAKVHEFDEVPITDDCMLQREGILLDVTVPASENPVAMFLGGDEWRFYSLLCYLLNTKYTTVIKHEGNKVQMDLGDCTSWDRLNVIVPVVSASDDVDLSKSITVGSRLKSTTNRWKSDLLCLYQVHWTQKSVTPLLANDLPKVRWYQTTRDNCPDTSEIIYMTQDAITTELNEGNVVSMYLDLKEEYMVTCYHVDSSYYVAEMRKKTAFVMYIKGKDCRLHNEDGLPGKQMVLYRGVGHWVAGIALRVNHETSTPQVGEPSVFQCLYKVTWSEDPGTATVERTYSAEGSGKPDWIQIPYRPLRTQDIFRNEANAGVAEDQLVAKYLSRGGSYTLSCYGNDILVLRTLTGNFKIAFKGMPCQFSTDIQFLRIAESKIAGVILDIGIDKHAYHWVYRVTESKIVAFTTIQMDAGNHGSLYWSQKGVSLDKTETLDKVSTKTIEKTLSYEDDLVLECYTKSKPYYFLRLRVFQDVFIGPIQIEINWCDLLQKGFSGEMVLHDMTESKILRMTGKEDRKKIAEFLKSPQLNKAKTWLYLIPPRDTKTTEKRWEELNDCTNLERRHVSAYTQSGSSSPPINKYLNGRKQPVTIECYDKFAVVITGNNKIQIHLLCQSSRPNFYIDDYGAESVLIGSLKSIGEWCWLIIQGSGQLATRIKNADSDYALKYSSHQWYSEPKDNGNCRDLGRDQIEFSLNRSSSKKLQMAYLMDMMYGREIKETLVLYCYDINSVSILDIYKIENDGSQLEKGTINSGLKFLASLTGYTCTPDDLRNKLNVFISEDKYPDATMLYLSIGTNKRQALNNWCYYDIYFDGNGDSGAPVIQINKNVASLYSFVWESKMIITDVPTLKGQISISDETKAEGKNIQVMRIKRAEEVEQDFILECYSFYDKKTNELTFLTLLRTSNGIALRMYDFECVRRTQISYMNFIGSIYLLVKQGDRRSINGLSSNTLTMLNSLNPSEKTEIVIIVTRVSQSMSSKYWISDSSEEQVLKNQFKGSNNCPVIDTSLETGEQFAHFDMISKYKYHHPDKSNNDFVIRCYARKGDDDISEFVLSIWDSQETDLITTVRNVPCHSEDELRGIFDISRETIGPGNDEVVMFNLKPPKTCGSYSLVFCSHCKETSWRHYKPHVKDDKVTWTTVPTDLCGNLKSKKIHWNFDVSDLSLVEYYVSGGRADDKTFLLMCYQAGDGSFVTRLQTLNGNHVVTVKSFDCSSYKKLNGDYIKSGGDKIFAFLVGEGVELLSLVHSASEVAEIKTICRYGICDGCKDNPPATLSQSLEELSPRLLTWSMGGRSPELFPGAKSLVKRYFTYMEKKCEDYKMIIYSHSTPAECKDCYADATNANLPSIGMECRAKTIWESLDDENKVPIGSFVHTVNPEYSMTCTQVARISPSILITIKGPNTKLIFQGFRNTCSFPMSQIYFYTMFEDQTFRLEKIHELKQTDNGGKAVKHESVFVFDEELPGAKMMWKPVSAINVELLIKNHDACF